MAEEDPNEKPPPIFAACKPIAEVKMIEISLSLTGYSPFVCDEETPPEQGTRYLRQTIEANFIADQRFVIKQGTIPTTLWGPISSRDSKTTEEAREIDPYTSLTCITGDVGFTMPSGFTLDEESCTETQLVYESEENRPKCDEDEEDVKKQITYKLSNAYSIDDVANKVDEGFGMFNWSDLPANNTKGTALFGSGGLSENSALMLSRAGTEWSAIHTRSETSVTKRKLRVEFIFATKYTKITTDSNGEETEEVLDAEEGEVLEIDPPVEENSKIEIFACQFLSDCLLPQVSEFDYSSKGVTQKRILDPEGEGDCEYYYVSADGRFFEQLSVSSTQEVSASGARSQRFSNVAGSITFTDTYSNQKSLTTTIISTPCETVSTEYSGEGIETSTSTDTIEVPDQDPEIISWSCTKTTSPTEDGFESTSEPENCELPWGGGCGSGSFWEEVEQEGEEGENDTCECEGKDGSSTNYVHPPEGDESACAGQRVVTPGRTILFCENTSLSSSSSSSESCSYSCSFDDDPGEEATANSQFSSSSGSSSLSELINEVVDPFDKLGMDDGEPTESENETCASRQVYSSSSNWTTVEDIKWEIEVTPAQLTDEDGNYFEHKTHFQHIISELDYSKEEGEDKLYCPELKYEAFTDSPLDTRTPSEPYELEKTIQNLSVTTPRTQKCIVHAVAVVELVYDENES